MLLEEIKKVSKHTLIYGLGSFLSSAVGFFLIPLYTHFLSPLDYGILELIDLTGYVLLFLFSLSLDQAVLRFYNLATNENEKATILSSSILFAYLFSSLILLAIAPFSSKFSEYIVGTPKYGKLFFISFFNLFLITTFSISKTILRVENRSIMYSIFNLGYTAIAASLNIYFIAILQIGIVGYLYSTLISSLLLGTILSSILLIRSGRFLVDFVLIRKMLIYSTPFIPSAILLFVLNWSDRYILRLFSDLTSIGIYALAYKISMILVYIIVVPFDLIWNSYIFEISSNPHSNYIYSRFSTYFLLVTWFLGLSLSLFSREIIFIMSDASYHSAHSLVPLLVLGMLFMTSAQVLRIGILISGKTSYFPISNGIAALLNVVLNFAFIPFWGTYAAALTTCISFFISSAIQFFYSQKLMPIEYEYSRILKILLITFLFYFTSLFIEHSSLVICILLKMILILFYPFILFLTNFFNSSEIAFFKNYIKKVFA